MELNCYNIKHTIINILQTVKINNFQINTKISVDKL